MSRKALRARAVAVFRIALVSVFWLSQNPARGQDLSSCLLGGSYSTVLQLNADVSGTRRSWSGSGTVSFGPVTVPAITSGYALSANPDKFSFDGHYTTRGTDRIEANTNGPMYGSSLHLDTKKGTFTFNCAWCYHFVNTMPNGSTSTGDSYTDGTCLNEEVTGDGTLTATDTGYAFQGTVKSFYGGALNTSDGGTVSGSITGSVETVYSYPPNAPPAINLATSGVPAAVAQDDIVFDGHESTADATDFEVTPSVFNWNGYGGNPLSLPHIHGVPLTVEGQPKATASVWIEADDESGGHVHGSARPHGWLVSGPRTVIDQWSPNVGTYSHGLGDPLVLENFNGKTRIYYVAPGLGGREIIHLSVSCPTTHGIERTEVTRGVIVRAPGLTRLSAAQSPDLTVFGQTDQHPENDYGTPFALASVVAAAANYRQRQADDLELEGWLSELADLRYDFPEDRPPPFVSQGRGGDETLLHRHLPRDPDLMYVNDLSLRCGGLFDLAAPWWIAEGGKNPKSHFGHQDGSQIDVKTRHLTGRFAPYTVWLKGTARAGAVRNILEHLVIKDPGIDLRRNLLYDSRTESWTKRASKDLRRMSQLVVSIRARRLRLLVNALAEPQPGVVGIFAPEGDHIHVQYEQ